VLGYYQCPMLCTLVLNGLVESAADLKWSIGREFEVVDVSINPNESSTLAAAKKRAYLKRYGRSGAAAGWHFLTGNENSIRQLAEEVGFRYAYDSVSKQYAHASGLVILTSQGNVSGYLFGVTYPSSELLASLQRASSNHVASAIRQLILLCFHYNPVNGKYSRTILTILRVLGLTTLIGFLCFIVVLVRREDRASAAVAPASSETGHFNTPLAAEFVAPLNSARTAQSAVPTIVQQPASCANEVPPP
jgi:protein SCO1/2